jgi:deoxyribodipyrimidine photo-lyase
MNSQSKPTIVWLRLDLRLEDHPAFRAAKERGGPILPVFIWAPEEETPWAPGAASRWWLHHSLERLDEQLREQGSRLILRRGPSLGSLLALVKETGADAIYWNRRYEPAVIKRDKAIKNVLTESVREVASFNSALLLEPWTVENKSGRPFQVFTPFWKTCLSLIDVPAPLPALRKPEAPARGPKSLDLKELGLRPKIPWDSGLRETWQPGTAGAKSELHHFLDSAIGAYGEQRNFPAEPGTSRLSPHLHFGEISPHQVWRAVQQHAEAKGIAADAWRRSQFLTEIGWREFSHHLLFHFPHTTNQPLRAEFEAFPWRENKAWLEAWQTGRTGFPIVDAGMRELWSTGWMHNRVRMIVASFLVKNLLISWTNGTRWFWDTLVDADLANNTLGWQWTAGCGADAAPYFRIFNPMLQGEKFDPEGIYVKRWIPELAGLSKKWIHRPWELRAGADAPGYPAPLLSHSISRDVALEAYAKARAKSG